jgi:hypothetical protein
MIDEPEGHVRFTVHQYLVACDSDISDHRCPGKRFFVFSDN